MVDQSELHGCTSHCCKGLIKKTEDDGGGGGGEKEGERGRGGFLAKACSGSVINTINNTSFRPRTETS